MHEYTINKCSEMLERDRASVARALRKVAPDAGTPSRPLFRLATVVSALVAYETKPDGRRAAGDVARLAAERARLAREQADQVALKNAILRGEYVRLKNVQRGAETIFAAFRERILSIPGKLAAVCEMRSRAEIELVLRDECWEALEELSRPILPVEGPPEGRGSAETEDEVEGED
jgi:hypothetical protein